MTLSLSYRNWSLSCRKQPNIPTQTSDNGAHAYRRHDANEACSFNQRICLRSAKRAIDVLNQELGGADTSRAEAAAKARTEAESKIAKSLSKFVDHGIGAELCQYLSKIAASIHSSQEWRSSNAFKEALMHALVPVVDGVGACDATEVAESVMAALDSVGAMAQEDNKDYVLDLQGMILA
eukprot:SAG31_NODE_8758_length_1393_cov_1.262751_2_plen_179_part_01